MSGKVFFGLAGILGSVLAGVFGLQAGLPVRAEDLNLPPVAFLGPEFQVTGVTPETAIGGERPAVAANLVSNEALLVWENGGGAGSEIYAQRLSAGGKPVGSPLSIAGGGNHIQPAVAYNAADNEYLVAWSYDASGDGSLYEIWGRRVNGDGTPASNPFQVASSPSLSLGSPRLVWGSGWNQYMVVWAARSAGNPYSIQMKILQANGNPVVSDTLSASGVYPTQPDVTYNSLDGYYLVVWAQDNGDLTYSLIGDLRDIGGSRLKPDVITLFGPSYFNLRRPRAAFGSGLRYFVTFQFEYSASDHDVYMAFLDRTASSVPFIIYIAYTFIDEVNPQVAAHPEREEVMLAFQRGISSDAVVILRSYSSSPADREFTLCARSGQNCTQPALALIRTGSLAIYSAGPPGYWPQIHSREAWKQVLFLPKVFH